MIGTMLRAGMMSMALLTTASAVDPAPARERVRVEDADEALLKAEIRERLQGQARVREKAQEQAQIGERADGRERGGADSKLGAQTRENERVRTTLNRATQSQIGAPAGAAKMPVEVGAPGVDRERERAQLREQVRHRAMIQTGKDAAITGGAERAPHGARQGSGAGEGPGSQQGASMVRSGQTRDGGGLGAAGGASGARGGAGRP